MSHGKVRDEAGEVSRDKVLRQSVKHGGAWKISYSRGSH